MSVYLCCQGMQRGIATPYSLLPTPYSLLPTPYSLLPTPSKSLTQLRTAILNSPDIPFTKMLEE
ncbi:hypothetical protein BJP36_38580 [Moorena producens JHB]|uniref:Uncharacterized protein n=1 Tax=Moorena producens (strain JHB) TaxID=1454205 RepID=A0A9Q9SUP1_MOOP1|nr:hypothetical protein [Moorena producens]WAN69982.1 hypothetical protein BJP36_38580 [Moorena producens JHB]